MLVIERWEKDFREGVQRNYEWDVVERGRALKEAESARERERQKRIADDKALCKARADLLAEAVEGSAKAIQIRHLVHALTNRIAGRAIDVPDFKRWSQWALPEADALDLPTRSLVNLNEWCRRFRLGD